MADHFLVTLSVTTYSTLSNSELLDVVTAANPVQPVMPPYQFTLGAAHLRHLTAEERLRSN